MSVTQTVTLPNQPTVGSVILRPLGGNGYSSPMSMYVVQLYSVTCDASGGQASLDLFTDPQFESVFNVVQVAIASPAASAQVRFDFFTRRAAAAGLAKFEIQGTSSFDSDTASSCMLTPPPMFDMGRVTVVTDNVDTETVRLNVILYNFRRDAAQITPLAVLLSSLPRGFDVTGPFA